MSVSIGFAPTMQTIMTREPKKRKFVVVDLTNQPLGRVASKIADMLRGKHRSSYTPNVDTGDFVIAINASKIKLTGTKTRDKMYYWHSRFFGGLRETNADKLIAKHPDQVITRAVKGMLPQNDLSRKVIKKLRVYAGSEHPYKSEIKS